MISYAGCQLIDIDILYLYQGLLQNLDEFFFSFNYYTNVTISHRIRGVSGQRDYASEFQPFNRETEQSREPNKKIKKKTEKKNNSKKKNYWIKTKENARERDSSSSSSSSSFNVSV